MSTRALLLSSLTLGLALLHPGCSEEKLGTAVGTLRVTVLDAGAAARSVQVTARHTSGELREGTAAIATAETVLDLEQLSGGSWEARVMTLDGAGTPLRAVWVSDILILPEKVTEIRVELADAVPLPAGVEVCDGADNDHDGSTDEDLDAPLCSRCMGGFEAVIEDDARCGAISCASRNRTELRGDNTASGESTCVAIEHPDITERRCAARGRCIEASAERCTSMERAVATAGLCHTIDACTTGTPMVLTSMDGTPCGDRRVCDRGNCVPVQDPPVPEVGCADGAREGFLSMMDYPSIAACSGGFAVAGVTRANLVPTCGRMAGDDAQNKEGTGCSAADLCAAGWHVCRGKDDVMAKTSRGCGDAVPPGTPDKMLFFAVGQNSQNNSVCDPSTGDNDVFGCGNLGTVLGADKGCAPLNRVLASTQANSCGFNEAEPPLGPWQCLGPMDGHLHEGSLVTKTGCPSTGCSYNGSPIASWDKGGVLCCRD